MEEVSPLNHSMGVQFLDLSEEVEPPLPTADRSILLSVVKPTSLPLPGQGGVWVTPRRRSPECEFGDATAILKSLQLNPNAAVFEIPCSTKASNGTTVTLVPPVAVEAAPVTSTAPPAAAVEAPPSSAEKPAVKKLNAASAPFIPNFSIPLPTSHAQHIHINNLTANLNYHIRADNQSSGLKITGSTVEGNDLPLPFTVNGSYLDYVHPFQNQDGGYKADGYPSPVVVYQEQAANNVYYPMYQIHERNNQPTAQSKQTDIMFGNFSASALVKPGFEEEVNSCPPQTTSAPSSNQMQGTPNYQIPATAAGSSYQIQASASVPTYQVPVSASTSSYQVPVTASAPSFQILGMASASSYQMPLPGGAYQIAGVPVVPLGGPPATVDEKKENYTRELRQSNTQNYINSQNIHHQPVNQSLEGPPTIVFTQKLQAGLQQPHAGMQSQVSMHQPQVIMHQNHAGMHQQPMGIQQQQNQLNHVYTEQRHGSQQPAVLPVQLAHQLPPVSNFVVHHQPQHPNQVSQKPPVSNQQPQQHLVFNQVSQQPPVVFSNPGMNQHQGFASQKPVLVQTVSQPSLQPSPSVHQTGPRSMQSVGQVSAQVPKTMPSQQSLVSTDHLISVPNKHISGPHHHPQATAQPSNLGGKTSPQPYPPPYPSSFVGKQHSGKPGPAFPKVDVVFMSTDALVPSGVSTNLPNQMRSAPFKEEEPMAEQVKNNVAPAAEQIKLTPTSLSNGNPLPLNVQQDQSRVSSEPHSSHGSGDRPDHSSSVRELEVSTAEKAPEVVEDTVKPTSWASLFKDGSSTPQQTSIKPTARITPFLSSDSSQQLTASLPPDAVKSKCRELGKYLLDYQLSHLAPAIKPCGLSNRSNWCFVNSILQALLACPPFYNLFKHLPLVPGMHGGKPTSPMIESLIEFVHEFAPLEVIPKPTKREKVRSSEEIRTGACIEPSYIYKMLLNLSADTFRVVEGRQEDAEEFLTCLLNGVSDEMSELIKHVPKEETVAEEGADVDGGGDDWQEVDSRGKHCITRRVVAPSVAPVTPIQAMALGMCRSSLRSANGETSATLQPFFTLQLDIQHSDVTSINQALLKNFDCEDIDGYICQKTKQVVEASRSLSLEELPSILILHMKRFVYDGSTGGVQKVMKPVDFSVDLEIPKSVLSYEARPKLTGKQRQYKLFAVVYHTGREATKGHYVTDVYHTGYSAWLHCDDGTLTETAEDSVLNPAQTSTPYILFYRRGDTMVGLDKGKEKK